MNLLESEFYKRYIGDYAKRFYTPFVKNNIVKIVGFELRHGEAYIEVEQNDKRWFWDMDDSIIITNEELVEDIYRVANVNHEQYQGYNPFKK